MSAPPEKRDFSGMAAVLLSDHELIQSPGLPYGSVYDGHQDFLNGRRRWLRDSTLWMLQSLRLWRMRQETRLWCFRMSDLGVKATQEELKYPFCQVMKVDKEAGVITEMRPFYWDVAGLNAALAKG
jgi:hypothetical protein